MKTILDIPTKGDAMTMVGGIVLRFRNEAPRYVVHYYNQTSPDGPRDYHQGGYHTQLSTALDDMEGRVRRAEGYDAGGALDLDRLSA